jgi:hypothetical protein
MVVKMVVYSVASLVMQKVDYLVDYWVVDLVDNLVYSKAA